MKLRKAFSLTELSVVVLVASAVLVGILSVQTSSNSTNKVKVTHDRIGQVYRALKVYTGSHKKLPCPASIAVAKNDPAYGNEGSCAADTVVYGMVPVKALNLAAEFAEDDYGNKLVYVVDSTFTVATTPSKFVDQEGDIVVKRYSSSLGVEESNVIFAVISRGKNQRGAVSSLATVEINAPDDVDELENMPSVSDAILISGSNRSGNSFDDIVFFKNKKYFLADADLSKLQDSNLMGCTSGSTRVGGDCVVQCDVPTTIGINSGSKVNQGTSQSLACNAPNFDTSDSINYSCSGSKVYTYNSGSCDCNSGYALSGSSCAAITCSITGASGFNNKTGLAYATSATAISTPCQVGYSGAPTYTCTSSGPATTSGSCTATTCSITGVSGFNNKTGLAYATSATDISTPCQAGYSGTPTYTCTTSGAASVSGTCTAITCTIAAANGFNAKSGLAYASSATTISSPCQAGYTGTPTYTCTTTGAASVSGTCAITCTIAAANGFNAKSGLAYASSPTAISSPCQAGYSGTPTYTCTTSGAASVSGTCTAITCTIAAANGFNAKSGLAYASSATTISSPCQAGYTGTPTYTCTTTGAASVSGTCVLPAPTCTGGNSVITSGGRKIHTFTSGGTFACSAGSTTALNILVAGGGGGGGTGCKNTASNSTVDGGGGGAGGQVQVLSNRSISGAISSTVSIGGSGSGGSFSSTGNNGGSGGSSSISASGGIPATTSAGGGGGGKSGTQPGSVAGPAGGGGHLASGGTSSGNSAWYGGNGGTSTYNGGGGGASSSPNTGSFLSYYSPSQYSVRAGDGQYGTSSAISGATAIYGAGGGGGCSDPESVANNSGWCGGVSWSYSGTGDPGTGGGGKNCLVGSTIGYEAKNGANGGGGGGGGGSYGTAGNYARGANGGGGVVIFSYPYP